MNTRDDPRIYFDAGAQVDLSAINFDFSVSWNERFGDQDDPTVTAGTASGSGSASRVAFVPQNIASFYSYPDYVAINGDDSYYAYFDTKFCIPRSGCNPYTQPVTAIFGLPFLGGGIFRALLDGHYTATQTHDGDSSTYGNHFPVLVEMAFSVSGKVDFTFSFLGYIDGTAAVPSNVDFEGVFRGPRFDGPILLGGLYAPHSITMLNPARMSGINGTAHYSTTPGVATGPYAVIDNKGGRLTANASFTISAG